MVGAEALRTTDRPQPLEAVELPEEEFSWCSVNLLEALDKGLLLKAAVFGIEGRHARELLDRCKWPLSYVAGAAGLARAFHFPRFKRIWLETSDLPIYQPGQVTELDPRPSGYLSPITQTDIDALRVSSGQILMTCSGRSGSIGRTTYVSKTLHDRIFSHDLIRIECTDRENSGYLYAFLRTQTGRALVKTNEYGAMIPHIEPSHLENVPVPNPPPVLKKRIHNLVMRSYALRDNSNELLHEGEQLLYDALNLPPISKLRVRYFDKTADLRNYSVELSRLDGRLDASYHVPIVDAIMRRLEKEAAEITTIGDPRISKRVMLPGRFTRVYVQEGQGAVYFTGKRILELDPSDKKYLAFARHADRIRDQLAIRENMLLVTSSGTLGKVALVPRHWDGWTMTHDIVRLVFASNDLPGYVWVFLRSAYGQELLRRYRYGAVVGHIEAEHVLKLPVPLPKDPATQAQINRLALEANAKRTEAYHVEQEAIRIVNEEVIHASEHKQSSI